MCLKGIRCPEKIVEIMNLIYQKNMTTISGGNLSILDENGEIWITPSGVDKGNLHPEDIVRIGGSGEAAGRHSPSIELPFHVQIYKARPDVRAIIHAHPPALIAASLVHKMPPLGISPVFRLKCGKIDVAEYALPGSGLLGENIAEKFSQGCSAVILENHGVVAAGQTLDEVFSQFELLNSCADIAIKGASYAALNELDDMQYGRLKKFFELEKTYTGTTEYQKERKELFELSRRIYGKGFSPSGFFLISCRTEDGRVLVSDPAKELRLLAEQDFVLLPGEADPIMRIHGDIYERQPGVRSVIMALPPHTMGFACADKVFDSRLIPESYMVMREVKTVDYSALLDNALPDMIERRSDVFLIKNAMTVVCGESPLKAYDRLEVLEFSARAADYARSLGDIFHIAGQDIEDIHRAFGI